MSEYIKDNLTESDLPSAARRLSGFWLELIKVVVLTLVFYMFFQTFIFKSFLIPSMSMYPTFQKGDHLVVSRAGYSLAKIGKSFGFFQTFLPKNGDIVVFSVPVKRGNREESRLMVKRVVGVPGDLVEVKDFRVYLNGIKSFERYFIHLRDEFDAADEALARAGGKVMVPEDYGPIKLGTDEFFVLGDNRVDSTDSRVFGPIGFSQIVGKAWIVLGRFVR